MHKLVCGFKILFSSVLDTRKSFVEKKSYLQSSNCMSLASRKQNVKLILCMALCMS